ncbi:splicing factor U2af large subunit A-like isoform X3 [Triticum aestivum]|uniref:Splicing factor U2af large subunit n=1 Tax=Aegilops tauschii TaxID=37682 RepID=M8CA43_AEGTA|nr:splicing factor U2af large subunit A-like isoform X3 [Triticum aestivum]
MRTRTGSATGAAGKTERGTGTGRVSVNAVKGAGIVSATIATTVKRAGIVSATIATAVKRAGIVSATIATTVKGAGIVSATIATTVKGAGIVNATIATTVKGAGIVNATIATTVKGVREGSTVTVPMTVTAAGAVIVTLKEIIHCTIWFYTINIVIKLYMGQPHMSFHELQDWDRDRDGHRRHRSRSRSRSESQSKRMSGFDQAPSEAIPILAPTATPVQIPELPAANPGMFPNMLPNLVNVPALGQPLAMTQQATRHARRVYVGGLPPIANEQTVAVFFNQVMAAIGGNTFALGHAVVNVYINHDKKFAFVEMRSVEEASNAMALDGIMFEGAPVKVRRPTDYNPSQAATLGPSQPNPNLNLAAVGLTPGAAGGLEGPDRIFVGGLPYYFTEAQVRELLETFGPLRGFDIVKDKETGNSKGYAFCLYKDVTVTDIACAALNGIQLGDRTLTVRRANQGAEPRPEQENILLQAQQEAQMKRLVYEVGGALATKVVCLTQVVSADGLRDDEEYNDILEDMTLEGHKYGNLVQAVIPRPHPSGDPVAGVGKVFLEYADVESSAKARIGMHGRKFDGKETVAVFYPENKFVEGDYDY